MYTIILILHYFFLGTVLLEKAGATVHGIISDGASTNRKAWTEFGVSGDLKNTKCFFTHPVDDTRKMFVMSDTPHLLKTIRNRVYELHEKFKTGLKVHILKYVFYYVKIILKLVSYYVNQYFR